MDWERRVAELADLKGAKLRSHQMTYDPIKDIWLVGKVPSGQVIDCAEARGLTCSIVGDTLHIAAPIPEEPEKKPVQQQQPVKTKQQLVKQRSWHERRGQQRC